MDQRGPETSNPQENKPKEPMDFLYKGMHVGQFGDYFAKGGIFPTRPDGAWITQNWGEAARYAVSYAGEVGRFRGSFFDPICIAVIDKPSVLERGGIKIHTRVSERLTDYSGEDIIKWGEVLRLFCTNDAVNSIQNAYNAQQPSDISWEDVSKKIVILSSEKEDIMGRERQFEKALRENLGEIVKS